MNMKNANTVVPKRKKLQLKKGVRQGVLCHQRYLNLCIQMAVNRARERIRVGLRFRGVKEDVIRFDDDHGK